MTKPIDEKGLEQVQGGDGGTFVPTSDIQSDRRPRPRSPEAGDGGISIPPDTRPYE